MEVVGQLLVIKPELVRGVCVCCFVNRIAACGLGILRGERALFLAVADWTNGNLVVDDWANGNFSLGGWTNGKRVFCHCLVFFPGRLFFFFFAPMEGVF